MTDVQQLISQRDSTPLPELVAQALREQIAGGTLRPGQRLPSEPELASAYRVSRNTLRDALGVLVTEGLIVRRHGRGTFVNPAAGQALQGGLSDLMSTSELIRRGGYEPGTVGLRARVEVADHRVARAFAAPPTTRFLHVTRTRLASGTPVIHCEEYLPDGAIDIPSSLDDGSDWSLYKALIDGGLAPAFANCKVRPIVADRAIGQRLDLRPGQPLLLLEQIHYTADGRPVLYCENWHNSSLLEFQIVRKS